jgi:hypothetical protein
MANNSVPSFNDICGTVVESLAETIQNREKIIIQLREENARLQRNAGALQNEVEACAGDEQKICELRNEVRDLKIEIDEANKIYQLQLYEVRNLRNQLIVLQNLHNDCDKQCKDLLHERDVARRLYCVLAANGSPATPPAYIAFQWGWDCFPQDNDPTPFLFDQSDSDPRTGVQYGDLH